MNKTVRQERILELVRKHPVHTQHEILTHLKSLGVEATQVTVSRDLHELRLVKTAEGYQTMNGAPPVSTLARMAREFLLGATPARNLVVLRTKPGNAMSIAKALDEEEWPDIVGTIGGDDTVLVIARNDTSAKHVARKVVKLRT